MKKLSWIPRVGLTYFNYNVTKICIKIRLVMNSLALQD